MLIRSYIKQFSRDTGAGVTVDWVVLAAALVALAISVIVIINGAIDDTTITLSTNLNTVVADVLP